DVASAGDLDDLRDPTDPGDQRIHPLFEVDARPLGPHRGVLAYVPDLVGDVLDHAPRSLLTAESSTDDEDCFQDVVERALVRAQHAGAGGDEVADDVALEIGERQHEVGLEGQDPIEL